MRLEARRWIRTLARRIGLRPHQTRLTAKLKTKAIYWFETEDAPQEVKALAFLVTNKLAQRNYMTTLGLRLPKLLADAGAVDEIDFAGLPDQVVIKPHNSWSSDGVMLFDGERELLSDTLIPRQTLSDYCRKEIAAAHAYYPTRIVVEEFVRDYDPRFIIPRDFKVFVAGGKAWIVQVIDRNPPKEQRTHCFYNKDWTRLSDPFHTGRLRGASIDRPPFLDELISVAERLAQDLGAFLRLDFYLTSEGPVFGEITWSPDAGYGFTRYGDRYLCDLIDRFPDRIRSDLNSLIDV